MSIKKLESLSVFFPVYNEEQNLVLLIESTLDFIKSITNDYELIIVNDGSTDDSLTIANKLAKKYPCLRVISHGRNLGYGAALKTGFNNSSKIWTFFTDADMQFNIKDLEQFIAYIDQYDVIIGKRKKRAEGQARAINARLYKVFIDLLFRLHIEDIDCAFKLIKTKLVQDLNLESSGAFTTAEILYRLKKKNIKFKQLPVNHLPRKYGQPTGNKLKVIIKAAIEAFKLYIKIKFK